MVVDLLVCLPSTCELIPCTDSYIILFDLLCFIDIQHHEHQILSGACVGELGGWLGWPGSAPSHQKSPGSRFLWPK